MARRRGSNLSREEEMRLYREMIERQKQETLVTFRDPEGGLHTLPMSQYQKLPKPKRPIIQDGKTLDELVTDPMVMEDIREGRAMGLTDQEMWEKLQAPPKKVKVTRF